MLSYDKGEKILMNLRICIPWMGHHFCPLIDKKKHKNYLDRNYNCKKQRYASNVFLLLQFPGFLVLLYAFARIFDFLSKSSG